MSDLEHLTSFTIFGEPLPKERPRFGGRRAYTPKKTVDAERRVVEAFDLACPLWDATTDNIRLEADFYRKGWRSADGDNLMKLVSDALSGVLYRDDKQVCEGEFRRVYGAGDKARTEVRVYLVSVDITRRSAS